MSILKHQSLSQNHSLALSPLQGEKGSPVERSHQKTTAHSQSPALAGISGRPLLLGSRKSLQA
jgi:hypothetical protein